MVHAFIASGIDYCSSVLYGISAVHIRPLQNVLNAAARLLLRRRKFDHINDAVRDKLHWLPVVQRIEFKVCMYIYKCLRQSAPSYLCAMCVPVLSCPGQRQLHSATRDDLAIPRFKLQTYGHRSFPVSGPALWNSLPLTARDLTISFSRFRVILKTVMFNRAYKTFA